MINILETRSQRKKTLPILLVLIFCLFAPTAFGQTNDQTRSITSDVFASQRPSNKNPRNNRKKQTSSNSRVTYNFLRKEKNVFRRKSVSRRPRKNSANTPEKVSEVGVTIWKMRPPRASDPGFKLPVLDARGNRQMWTAERVGIDTIFQAGDRVRIMVEASNSGYLYVINSEIYTNGTFGEPFLIFPANIEEDNSVKPGLLVDIPDQTEDLPYFVINPKRNNYAGELLTVIVSPKPLTNLKTDSNGKIKALETLESLEENADSEIYKRTDNKDKIYSEAEANAACGAKARQQNNRQLERPCGAKTRLLTRDEPLPQTIFRVKTAAGEPTVMIIRLNVSN
jgi:hypothetical protein